MNQQQDPVQSIAEALQTALKTNIPQIKNVLLGWVDAKDLQVDKNLPTVAIVDISETSTHKTSMYDVHKTTVNPDGVTGYIYTEKLRLAELLQISLFTNTKQDRSKIGWAIKQFLVANLRLQLSDGEYALFKLRGDHQSEKGETNFYRRDLTFEVTARVLDATPATKVTNITNTVQVNQLERT